MPDVCATCSSWNPNGESEFGACVNQNSPRFGQFTHGTRITCELFGRVPVALSGVRAFLIDLLENPPAPPPEPEPEPIPEPDPEPVVEPDPEPTPEEPPAADPQPDPPPEEPPPADPVEPPADEPMDPEIPDNG